MFAAFAAVFLFIAALSAESQALDGESNGVISVTESQSTNSIRVFLSCINTLEATVRIKCSKLENMTATHVLPYEFIVKQNYRKYEILRFLQRDSGFWQCQYDYLYKIG